MTDEPTYLATERAARAGHAGAWNARDALPEALRRIDAGELNLEQLWIIGVAPNGYIHQINAGTTNETTVAVLEVVKLDTIRMWQEGRST